MGNLLVVDNIYKAYLNHVALDSINLNIKKNSIFGLLGPNGAGKTTLIRLINQITKPDKGTILFDSEKLNKSHISKIGYLPEERGLYKKMKVGEQVIYLAQLKGMNKKEAIEKLTFWFNKFNISDWWEKTIEQLSKGMAQKIQFITTVVHQPELIILDEPFSGFDPLNTELIKREILNLKEKGSTVIFSTHNMESVEEICDEIALINKSKKVLSGDVAALKKKYDKGLYSIEFEGSKVGFTNALWSDFKLLKIKEHKNKFLIATIKHLNKDCSLKQLVSRLPEDINIISLNKTLPKLKDIFVEIVTKTS